MGLWTTGWHLPTDTEWKTMEMALGMSQSEAEAELWRGTDEGTQLRVGGTSRFQALLAGIRASNGTFAQIEAQANFWTSTTTGTYAQVRILKGGFAGVWRGPDNMAVAASVRCVKD